MESIRDQADHEVDFGNLSIECFLVGDIEGDLLGVLDTFTKLLSTLEGSAGCKNVRKYTRDRVDPSHTDRHFNT